MFCCVNDLLENWASLFEQPIQRKALQRQRCQYERRVARKYTNWHVNGVVRIQSIRPSVAWQRFFGHLPLFVPCFCGDLWPGLQPVASFLSAPQPKRSPHFQANYKPAWLNVCATAGSVNATSISNQPDYNGCCGGFRAGGLLMVTVTAAQCAVCLWALAQMSLCDFMAQRERKLKVVLTLDCHLKGLY